MGQSATEFAGFAEEIVRWQGAHGRNSLPWQNTRDPYRVWLSEIMLQQTQVSTVLDYYARFLERFPTVADLAEGKHDAVMALWSGLGYYSRARNLHRCAQDVMSLHGGQFPRTSELLQTLTGIGRSTAAAIASFCFAERVPILDGNVKRVLTRVIGFSADLAQSANERALWGRATDLLPAPHLSDTMPRYSQGLMDLGATVCTLRQPQCALCPVQKICRAFAAGEPLKYPVKTRKMKRSAQALSLLWAQRPDGSVWLEKRPVTGIWGGLYCLPVFVSDVALKALLPLAVQARLEALPHFVHVLTHKDLHLSPWIAGFRAGQAMPKAMNAEDRPGAWFGPEAWPGVGLPAPIRRLLARDFVA
ncbi:MAG: A/G-specific adenine glycosylase [Polaromonas sp.]|uniref:A/G-specific adenine glycosylase n=1 Tax=Polaromonas sp. TaxID=1869339 RepID=UPI0017F78188|nr:A/G-specific adenine glycosylase [Polaromonas sp.]NMM08902.1 A/G-specific adenine glycosylase [Polaromonas sp.]